MEIKQESATPRGAVTWMAGNSVAANLLMLVLLVGGLFMATKIKQEVFPEYELGIVNVSVTYPGASPEEVERGVVLAIEEAVQGLDGLDEIRSTALEGRATINLEVLEGVDVRSFAQEVESQINAITSFPDEAEDPMVSVVTRRRRVISFAVFGSVAETVLRERAEALREMLLQDPAITQVELNGVRDYEIHIEVPQENLRRYDLTLAGIAAVISTASVDLPGGSLKTDGGEILVRMKERRESAPAYGKLAVITLDDGTRVLLKDIAIITEGFEDTNAYATFNGKPAIMLEVYRVGDQKPVAVADASRLAVAAFNQTLLPGLGVAMVNDMSQTFKERGTLLLKNGYMGLGLVFILLALFLDIRLAFWVSLGIPISLLGAFILLPLTNFSINLVSMFAFIVTIGIVVDDAIVVGENVYHYRQMGFDFLESSIRGTREVAMPVVFSILTNVVAFLPIMFVPGTMGKFFKIIPVVVITVFMVSLAESIFILPAHLAHGDSTPPGRFMGWITTRQQRVSNALVRFVKAVYTPLLERVLEYRYITLAVGLAILIIVGAYVKSGRIPTTLMPRVESDYAFVTATLPYGSAENKVAEVVAQISRAAESVIKDNGGQTLSRGFYAQVDENVITSRIILTPSHVRPISTTRVTELWRSALGPLAGLESLTFQADRGGPASGSSLTIELSHQEIETLTLASEALARELGDFPSSRDIDDGSARGKQQLDFTMLALGEMMGFKAREVALQVRHAFYGAQALQIQRGRNELTVRVRLPEAERSFEHNIETLMVRNPLGEEALLREVVAMDRGRAYTAIERRGGRRISTVSANVIPRDETNQLITVLKEDILPRLEHDYPGLTSKFQGRQADMRDSTTSLISGLFIALFVIYALLAVPFKSYVQPFVIMAAIPFGLVGAVIGHILLGYSLSLMSLFGLVALSGVVVNDSLVLVDFANRSRRNGLSAHGAIVAAGTQRFRPIMLTTLTTFGGLAPMIFETSRQARFMIPMAISLGFGILFATLITLGLVPTFYLVVEDLRDLLSGQSRPSEPSNNDKIAPVS
ncbi:cobalt-zinc-cadmium resistance protein CzcA-like protein [Desulforapulum autotrophicum HRM2]|uniref:Cobalt-zinc-cadmium resistance protein CzcA-like protein n=1 Tax=Desulforapulum autotrophicum (strain ATCC 43914 / DSM 3382 / VKM B-1955 / HRM2) TaxID=177437 RepID=C0QFG3_DESAH|nr:efflux RND transporter permease subunit [Desulforapulum autotrophicum]ACN13359.1 cobalt-zinc-cadmium resistance protein CzcA-like protein [Desulforapulum autotrophicum HRM2]